MINNKATRIKKVAIFPVFKIRKSIIKLPNAPAKKYKSDVAGIGRANAMESHAMDNNVAAVVWPSGRGDFPKVILHPYKKNKKGRQIENTPNRFSTKK